MEDSKVIFNNVDGSTENGSSSVRRPPIPISLGGTLAFAPSSSSRAAQKSLTRHPSLALTLVNKENVAPIRVITFGDDRFLYCGSEYRAKGKMHSADVPVEQQLNEAGCDFEFIPILRSGAWTDIGSRSYMEDVYVCADSLTSDYGLLSNDERPSAFYGVFDGHGGKHAADFACYHLPRLIIEDADFPQEMERVMASAFLQTDTAFAEACSLDTDLASGTTAIAAVVTGRSLVVANAGDCRAVLCRKGKAVEMSRDHKPACVTERIRIEACGGSVYDGYLNGQINVARALGDWHMEGLKWKGGGGPLSAEPEVMRTRLSKEDEFMIIGCDGVWDVFMSQNAVDFARRRLQEHNDPMMCSKDLVEEALKRKSGDNLSVIVVCFQPHPPPNLVVPRGRVQRSISAEGLKELQSFLDDLEIT